jgi:hypothetical protein
MREAPTFRCDRCKHPRSVHKVKETKKDGRMVHVIVRCSAELDNGDECGCKADWFHPDYKGDRDE